MSFAIGQRVVCVDDRPAVNPWHRAHPLTKGRIYVVRSLNALCGGSIKIDDSGRLWECRRFRPIVERDTDISVFKRMLAPSDKFETTQVLQ